MNSLKFVENEIAQSIRDNSLEYLRLGLNQIEKFKQEYQGSFQTAMGNLGIAVELMLKAVIANETFAFLFNKSLPDELFMRLTYPERFKDDPINWGNELRSQKTIEFNEAVGRFYILYPKIKKEFRQYLSCVSDVRNLSVHFCLPRFQRYELDRIVYISLRLLEFLASTGLFKYQVRSFDTSFLQTYEEQRVERVKTAVKAAKEKCKKSGSCSKTGLKQDDGNHYIITCPVCSSDAALVGYYETRFTIVNDFGAVTPYREFYAEAFECDICDLKALDSAEIELLGMETEYFPDLE